MHPCILAFTSFYSCSLDAACCILYPGLAIWMVECGPEPPGLPSHFQVLWILGQWKSIKSMKNQWKSMKIYENPWKSMIINRKRWKSSDDKKPAWNRAKVSIGAPGCFLPLYTVVNIHARKSMKIYENLWKSMQINENSWKSMKIIENPWKINENQKK